MTPPLFLVPDLGTGATIELTGAEAHHAGTVKRLRVGESALLADGRGGLAEARVAALGKDRVSFTVEHRRQVAQPTPRFTVVQALPKGERAELAVEVLTELGVDEIVPWSAARSVSSWKQDRVSKGVAKWQRTATEAAKQSRRAWIPQVAELAGTEQVASRISSAGLALVLDSDAAVPLAELAGTAGFAGRHAGEPAAEPFAGVLLVVGPEGGITAD
ncbi:MAG: 16S rRNA (uracil(1498)-N(3))-methyltransferase, partial [Jatrophihabitantaceae bacterium]